MKYSKLHKTSCKILANAAIVLLVLNINSLYSQGLLEPADGAAGVSLTPTLRWNKSPGISRWFAWINENSTNWNIGSKKIANPTNDSVAIVDANWNLKPNTRYYWIVYEDSQFGNVLGINSFTTGSGIPTFTITTTQSIFNICSGDTCTLKVMPSGAAGTISYDWKQLSGTSIPDSIIVSGGGTTDTSIDIRTTAAFTIRVIATDAGQANAKDTIDFYITPRLIVEPVITHSGQTARFCTGSSVRLAVALPYMSYQWMREGIDISGAVAAAYDASVGGAYSVRVAIGECMATSVSVNVIQDSLPQPVISGRTSVCTNEQGVGYRCIGASGSTYSWSISGAQIVGKSDSIAVVLNFTNGTAQLYVTETTVQGCSNTTSIPIVVGNAIRPTVLSSNGQFSFCPGGSVSLAADIVGNAYQWKNNNIEISGAVSQTYNAVQSGAYSVVVTSNGCTGESPQQTITLLQLPTPFVTAQSPVIFCDGDSVELRAVGNYSNYLWSTGATGSSIIVKQSGTYSVSVDSSNGCRGTSTGLVIDVRPNPTPSITQIGNVLQTQTADSYQWLDEFGADLVGETRNTFSPQNDGRYAVRVSSISCIGISPLYSYSGRLSSMKATIDDLLYQQPTTKTINGDSISVTIDDLQNISLQGKDTLFLKVRVRTTMFLPDRAAVTQRIKNETEITRAIPMDTLYQNQRIAVCRGTVLLGDVTTTRITLDSAWFASTNVLIQRVNGLLQLDVPVDQFGNPRLLRGPRSTRFFILGLNPNPSNGILNISIESTASLSVRYEVSSFSGQSVQSGTLLLKEGENNVILSLDAMASSGVYQFSLTNDNDIAIYPFTLIR